jgi:hypothetical protein
MIYAIITLFVLWFISSIYFLRHLALIIKELNEINKEQHQQNKDIMHLLKMNVEITKLLTSHEVAIQDIINYIEPSSKKKVFEQSNIFNPPKGEA